MSFMLTKGSVIVYMQVYSSVKCHHFFFINMPLIFIIHLYQSSQLNSLIFFAFFFPIECSSRIQIRPILQHQLQIHPFLMEAFLKTFLPLALALTGIFFPKYFGIAWISWVTSDLHCLLLLYLSVISNKFLFLEAKDYILIIFLSFSPFY